MPDEIINILSKGGLGAVAILMAMLMANFAGRWYPKGAVDKMIEGYKEVIKEKDSRILALQTDRNFYRGLVLQVSTNQERIVENQEKIVNIVDRQGKTNGTTD